MRFRPILLRVAPVLAVLLLGAILWSVFDRWSRTGAMDQARHQAEQIVRQHGWLIDSELARFRLLPVVLSEYTDLEAALRGNTPAAAQLMSEKLALLVRETGATIIYIMDHNGRVVSASNYQMPDSFVGRDLEFRPYFEKAMQDGTAEYYAQGAFSGRPGLFMARRVGMPASSLGVVVVKYEFDALTRIWHGDEGETLIVDPHGIVLAATDPTQELHPLRPLEQDEQRRLIDSGQFAIETTQSGGTFSYAEMPGTPPNEAMGIAGQDGRARIVADVIVAGTDLKLLHLLDPRAALTSARDRALASALMVSLFIAAFVGAVYWRFTRVARAVAYRQRLEVAVQSRTQALSAEIAERIRAEKMFRDAREELAQANRLASLGSITSGLVHEINQPVATIRTLAENARHHLGAGRIDKVARSIEKTISLTDRIGEITQEMRRFGRRKQGSGGPVPLDDVLNGALLILGDRFRSAGVRMDLPRTTGVMIMAERVRLEQVLVNLLTNALDAVTGPAFEGPDIPHVALMLGREGGNALITVADNGPGINPTIAEDVFSPFVTGKRDGLGLGLGIARDIMRDLEGSLNVVPSPLGGAAFRITIRSASDGR